MTNTKSISDLNDNNSRLLNIGEFVFPGCYWRRSDQTETREWKIIDPDVAEFGLVAEPDDHFEYRFPFKVENRELFSTGALRSNKDGEGSWHLLPYEGMRSYAQRLEYGVKMGYEPRNWEKGMPLSRVVSSLRRHAGQINFDFTEDHVGAVLFNAGALATFVYRIQTGTLSSELDDIGYIENLKMHGANKP